MPGKILRSVHIEANENVLQRVRVGERCGIDQLIIVTVNPQPGGLYLFQRLKSEIPRCVAVFELINGKGVLRHILRSSLFLLCGVLRLKLCKMPLDFGNKLAGGGADSFKGCFQLLNIAAAAPPGDIAKGVVRRVQPEMLAHRIGNAFRLHLAGAAVGALRLLRRVQVNIVQLGMGNLVDRRLNGLQLAHAVVNGNALFCKVIIAVCAAVDFFKRHGNGRGQLQGSPKILILFHIARERVHGNVGKLLALGLAHIEYRHHLERRNRHLLLLRDGLTVCADDGLPGVRVSFRHILFDFIRCGRKDFDALFAGFDMAFKFVTPLSVACDKGCVRLLHDDQQRIVQAVIVEAGHGFQIIPIPLTFKNLLYALFQMLGDFLDSALCVGGVQHQRTHGDWLGEQRRALRQLVHIPLGAGLRSQAIFLRHLVGFVPLRIIVAVVVDIAIIGKNAAILFNRFAPIALVIKEPLGGVRQFQLVQIVNEVMPVIVGIVYGGIKPVAVQIVRQVD